MKGGEEKALNFSNGKKHRAGGGEKAVGGFPKF